MRFQVSAVGLSCVTLLSACGGGGDATGNKSQSVDFPYPGPRYLATQPAPLAATATSGLAVTFASNTPGTCTVTDGNLVPVATGECSVTASQAGDSTYVSASSQQLFKVLKHPQVITFASPGFQPLGSTPAPLAATSDSSLPVSYASTTPAVCTVSGSTLTLLSKGQCSITASQEGNDSYALAPPQTVAFGVGDAPPPVLTFLSGFASAGSTNEGGSINTFAGSSIDGWWCSDPNWCGSAASADGSTFSFHYLVQTTDPKHPYTGGGIGAYSGFEILAPGVGSISTTGNTTTGLQVDKQTSLKLTLGENSEWFSTDNKAVKVTLVLGHFNIKGTSACNVAVDTIFTPTTAAPKAYELQLSSFTEVSEKCDLTPDAATELATYPIVKIKIEAATANTSVLSTSAATPTYPTEITLAGGITVE